MGAGSSKVNEKTNNDVKLTANDNETLSRYFTLNNRYHFLFSFLVIYIVVCGVFLIKNFYSINECKMGRTGGKISKWCSTELNCTHKETGSSQTFVMAVHPTYTSANPNETLQLPAYNTTGSLVNKEVNLIYDQDFTGTAFHGLPNVGYTAHGDGEGVDIYLKGAIQHATSWNTDFVHPLIAQAVSEITPHDIYYTKNNNSSSLTYNLPSNSQGSNTKITSTNGHLFGETSILPTLSTDITYFAVDARNGLRETKKNVAYIKEQEKKGTDKTKIPYSCVDPGVIPYSCYVTDSGSLYRRKWDKDEKGFCFETSNGKAAAANISVPTCVSWCADLPRSQDASATNAAGTLAHYANRQQITSTDKSWDPRYYQVNLYKSQGNVLDPQGENSSPWTYKLNNKALTTQELTDYNISGGGISPYIQSHVFCGGQGTLTKKAGGAGSNIGSDTPDPLKATQPNARIDNNGKTVILGFD